MRKAGVLAPISILPSPFGTGVFGKETYAFIDWLKQMDFSVWQVLPFTIVDSGNSPYSSVSLFAGNHLYIDLRSLKEKGILTQEETEKAFCSTASHTADYHFSEKQYLVTLKKAYSRFKNAQDFIKIESFSKEQTWVSDFALFMVLKEKYRESPWWEWKEKYHPDLKEIYKEEMDFWIFVQYIFWEQWQKVKTYANQKGIEIMGDLPIYPSLDSSDVWSDIASFQIDQDTFLPTRVAGVPPDYFSEEGQLWGNPIYDWQKMKSDGYLWWCRRMEHALSLFDWVRIDHFRAFASYFAVSYGAATAKEGVWIEGPGISLFQALEKHYGGKLPVVAEDLGTFGEDVMELLKKTGCPGMRVIQFGFDSASDSTHLPHQYPNDCVAYVGTHDNSTLLGWLWESDESIRNAALRYCGFHGENWGEGGFYSSSCRSIIEAVWRTAADTAVLSIQDMCGYGNDARMNIPGTGQDNWRFRITEEELHKIDIDYFKEINRIFYRK